MKTRIKLHLIIYIAFAGLFMACENEIPYNPGQQNPTEQTPKKLKFQF